MFEKSLEDKFRAIFGVKKVTYDAQSNAFEQECLFIEIDQPRIKIKDKRAIGRITGRAYMNGPNDKLKFGYFQACIDKASNALTKDLFFEEIETNDVRYRGLVQRGFSFTYFFNSQYDPSLGSIESIELNLEET